MQEHIHEIAPGLKNAGQPLPDVATAGQPEEEHFERLAEAGYRTVIDLRESGEDRGLDEPEAIRRAGMEYVNIPVGHEEINSGRSWQIGNAAPFSYIARAPTG